MNLEKGLLVVRRGDESSFAEFVRTRSAELLGTAYLLTGEPDYAENLLRTALSRAYRAGTSFRDFRAADLLVRKILIATVLSTWWSLVWRRVRPGLEETPAEAVQFSTEGARERDRLWEKVQHLPLEQRILVVLQYHDGFTEAETAEHTTSTVETVRDQTEQVLEALRRPVSRHDALEEVVRPDGVAAEPAGQVGRLLREMFAERVVAVGTPSRRWVEQTLQRARLARRSRMIAPVAAAAAVLVAALGATGLVGPGPATPEQLPSTGTSDDDGLHASIDRLPVGPPPLVPYAVGRTIVLSPDEKVELPNVYTVHGPFGLAGTGDGLLAVRHQPGARGTAALHIASDGNVTELDTPPGWYGSHIISPDGRYAAWTSRIGLLDESAFANIVDLKTGKIIASRRLPRELSVPTTDFRVPRIQAFDGNEALVVGYHPTRQLTYARWTPTDQRLDFRQGPSELESIWGSSLSADTMLAAIKNGAGDGCLVNIAISNPDYERWRLCDTAAVPFISPDAQNVALRQLDEPARNPNAGRSDYQPISIEVRDLDTGDVVVRHQIDIPQSWHWRPTWESGEALLITVQDSAKQTLYLLRCGTTAAGSCERVPASGVTAVAAKRYY